jgi:hypothetical protein
LFPGETFGVTFRVTFVWMMRTHPWKGASDGKRTKAVRKRGIGVTDHENPPAVIYGTA